MSSNLYQKIEHLIDVRQYQRARYELEYELKADPNNSKLLFYSAYIHWLQDNVELGIEVAQVGLSIAPDDQTLQHVLFLLLKDHDEHEKAELIVIELIRSNPRNVQFLCGYAELMLLNFHLKKARKLVEQALRISPDSHSSQLIATLVDISEGKIRDAEKKLEVLLEESPDDERVLRMLMIQLVMKKRYRRALPIAQTLLRRNPYDGSLINTIVELRACTHWTALPLWLNYRFGWIASIAIWAGFVALLKVHEQTNYPGFGAVIIVYLSWCIYSWIHQPIIEKWLRSKGV